MANTGSIDRLEQHCGQLILNEESINIDNLLATKDGILSNFKLLVENYVTKTYKQGSGRRKYTDYTLEFDLDKGSNIIWDMLFLSKMVLEKADEETKKEIQDKVNKNGRYSNIDINILGENLEHLSEEDINDIKKAVVICQKLRDALSHTGTGKKYKMFGNKIKLLSEHDKNKLKTTLQFKYIDEFGSGINPFKGDENIAKKIDEQVFRICDTKNYRMTNFFYRFHPKRVKYLIERFGESINLLGFPKGIFSEKCSIERINKILSLVGNDVNKLIQLPSGLFDCDDDKFDKLLEIVNGNINYYLNIKLPRTLFLNNLNIETLKYILSIVDINRISEFPMDIFTCSLDRLQEILNLVDNDITKLLDKDIRGILFIYKCDIERIKFLMQKLDIDIKDFNKFPVDVFLCKDDRLHYALSKFSDISIFKNNPRAYAFLFYEHIPTHKIEYLIEKGQGNIRELEYFDLVKTNILFEDSKIDYLINKLKSCNMKIADLKILPSSIFSKDCSIERIEYLLSLLDGDISRLKELPDNVFFGTESVNLIRSENSPYISYSNDKKSFLEEYGVNFSLLPIDVFREECDIERIKKLIEIVGDIRNLKKLPRFAFKQYSSIEKIMYLINVVGDYEKLKDVPSVMSQNFVKIERINRLLELSNNDIKILAGVPRRVFSCDNDRFESLLKVVDYNLTNLKKLPERYYTCSIGMIPILYEDSQISPKKEELMKSILGFNNEKMVALVLYLNAVFSNYDNDHKQKGLTEAKLKDLINKENNGITLSEEEKAMKISLQNKLVELNEKISNVEKLTIENFDITLRKLPESNSSSTIEDISTNLYSKKFGVLESKITNCANGLKGLYMQGRNLEISNLDAPKREFEDVKQMIGKQNSEILSFLRNGVCHFNIEENEDGTITIYDEAHKEGTSPIRSFELKTTIEDLYNFVVSYRNNVNTLTLDDLAKEIKSREQFVKEGTTYTPKTISEIFNMLDYECTILTKVTTELGVSPSDVISRFPVSNQGQLNARFR